MPGAAHLLGIPDKFFVTGLFVFAGGIIAWWIRGLADRTRARNEGVTVESAATKVLIDNLTAEIKRMQNRLEDQDKRITALEQEKREGLDREGVLRARNIELEAIIQSRGEVRQRAQAIVAADRMEGGRV